MSDPSRAALIEAQFELRKRHKQVIRCMRALAHGEPAPDGIAGDVVSEAATVYHRSLGHHLARDRRHKK